MPSEEASVKKEAVGGNEEKSKPTPKPKAPLTTGECVAALCMGGQVLYLFAASVISVASEAILGKEFAAELDVLFIPAGSAARTAVDGVQLVVRTVMAGALLLGGSGFLFLASLFVGGAGVGYLWLSSHNGKTELLLKHRRDIPGLFALGVPAGWMMWGLVETLTGLRGEDAIYPISSVLIATSAALAKYAIDEDEKNEIALKKKTDGLPEIIGNAKIGTVSYEGKDTQNVSVRDALNVASSLTSSNKSQLEFWACKNEILPMRAARVVGGVLYGYSLRVIWFFFAASALPILRNIVYGEQSFLLVYWRFGIRAALNMNKAV